MIFPTVMFFEIMNLGMAVVTGGNTIIGPGLIDLFEFYATVISTGVRKSGLKESTAAATAKIVGSIGSHIDEVLFTYHRFGYKPQIFGNGITEGLSDQLTGILHGKLDLKVFVPVGINLEPALPNPSGI